MPCYIVDAHTTTTCLCDNSFVHSVVRSKCVQCQRFRSDGKKIQLESYQTLGRRCPHFLFINAMASSTESTDTIGKIGPNISSCIRASFSVTSAKVIRKSKLILGSRVHNLRLNYQQLSVQSRGHSCRIFHRKPTTRSLIPTDPSSG